MNGEEKGAKGENEAKKSDEATQCVDASRPDNDSANRARFNHTLILYPI